MTTTTAVERAFARANVYRFLSLAFAYPTAGIHEEFGGGVDAVRTAAALFGAEVEGLTAEATSWLQRQGRGQLASDYRRTFTFSASPDCPLNECAYSAKHVYQEVQELADIAGFYSAFGLELAGERPDELAVELEFCGLLALKEGVARERGRKDQAKVCRDGLRLFLHDHLGRWAENIGRRIEVLAPETAYASLGRLLSAFAAGEIEVLKVGFVTPYQEVPQPREPLDDGGCPAEEGMGTVAYKVQDEDFIGELAAAGPPLSPRPVEESKTPRPRGGS